MWQQGQLTTGAYYYDSLRGEWLLLKTLIESKRELFSVEEAFVRLGQNRQRGCLAVYNKDETNHLFVEGGFVVCALAGNDRGEMALNHALHLEASAYEWFFDARAPSIDFRLNIAEYALRNSIAKDIRIANTITRKHNTETIPKAVLDRVSVRAKFNFVLVTDEEPKQKLKLIKMTSIMGRDDHSDLVVNHHQVSRRHCLLEVMEQNVHVKDLDSSNGTFVNNTPVRDGVLNAGDKLRLGSYQFVLIKEPKKAPDMA
jgi:hypothetical protein